MSASPPQTEIPAGVDGFRAWFEAAGDRTQRWPLTDVIYKAPDGSLLTVRHDMEELGKRSSEAWKELFESRAHTQAWPYGSGVWGKRELVCPMVDDDNIVGFQRRNGVGAESAGQRDAVIDRKLAVGKLACHGRRCRQPDQSEGK